MAPNKTASKVTDKSTGKVTGKKVKLRLVGLNGNAGVLLGGFGRAARDQGWTEAGIQAVFVAALAGDYGHLLRTLSAHCENGGKCPVPAPARTSPS